MIKKVLYWGVGFGVGFAIAFVSMVYFVFTLEENKIRESRDEFLLELNTMLRNMPEKTTDLCEGMVGNWTGNFRARADEDGYYWDSQYMPDNTFSTKLVYEGGGEVERRTGTWTCENSLLVNTFHQESGDKEHHIYIIVHMGDNRRVYMHIEHSEYGDIFVARRQ
ncbi:hypothetical protein [Pseudoalteromonas rubra]|uniref:Uncharacterized protein n=1 Tax=Pseudoalteromonas rubra TaxID=43658 RepID=A0A5S3X3P0_9GAMM|nr:hypothetical protein [Pseudoalteromonas rubra]TMP39083.1 hypothetical protein CWB98_03870 [Pseudoalteromonas rubra]